MYGDTEEAEVISEKALNKKIAVIEMFGPTIQGEGPLAGSKTMFIRFGGCDYRCEKCDSLHAVIPEAVKKHASYLTQDEIADRMIEMAQPSNTPWVTLSGGNPLMWDLTHLVDRLLEAGLMVAVETQGTLFQPWLQKVQCLVLSPKSPGMGERFEPNKLMDVIIGARSAGSAPVIALKIVIFSQQDIDFALDVAEFLANGGMPFYDGLKYLSLGNASPPALTETLELADGAPPGGLVNELLLNYRLLIEDMTNDPRVTDWRFMPQLHVLAFGNEAGR